MMWIYKVFLYVVVGAWLYVIRPLTFDLIMNLYHLIRVDDSEIRIKKEVLAFGVAMNSKFTTVKDTYLTNKFTYQKDPLWGLLDWFPRSILVLITKKFKDDCDGFAAMASFMYPNEGKRYVLVPLNPKYWLRSHVVYERANKIYSSGDIHRMTLKKYITDVYKYGEVIILRHF